MDIIRLVIAKPVAVAVGVILIVMFGLIGATSIPIQLSPNVDQPVITVSTDWPGRSPQEIVDEITKEQEERLKSIPNLDSMRSTTSEGSANITLEFTVGSDIGRALQEVSDALRQVPEYPADADEPVIQAAEGASESAIAWMIIEVRPEAQGKHPDFDPSVLFDALEKEVKPVFERVKGVAEVNIFGGREREARVYADPQALARHGLTYGELINALRSENVNISAGAIAEGKRDYRVRVVGQYESADQILNTIVAYRGGSPIYVHDVANVEIDYEKRRGFVRGNGNDALALNIIREAGSNVMEIMEQVRARRDAVERDILPNLHPVVGPDLQIRQVYDETIYITSAIDLVRQNLWIGGLLAAGMLMLFLRSFVLTGVVALAIPISVTGTFLVLLALGRSLNVISLAGLAFAVGMVVDNAIVVLENIFRRLQEGDPPRLAAYRGAREVWGAIFASTLTTVAVFIPILTIQEEAGQLFRDIALAVVAAVVLSLLVSITVIPAACSRWLRPRAPKSRAGRSRLRTLFGLTNLFAFLCNGLADLVHWLITGWRGWALRPAIIVVMTVASLAGAWALMPPLDYLPAGNRNLVFGGLQIPPGYSVEQRLEIARRIEERLKPYLEADPNDPDEVAALPPISRFDGPDFDGIPILNYFIGSFGTRLFMGARSAYPEVVIPVGQLLTNAMNSIPDARGFAQQSSLFGRGASGGGNNIRVEISGPVLTKVNRAAAAMFDPASQMYERVTPDPANFDLPEQEWRITVTRIGRELGLTTEDVGAAVRALFDGAFVGDFNLDGDAIDLVVVPPGGRLDFKEKLQTIPIYTPAGRNIPLDQAIAIEPALAPQEIQRIEELPSVALDISPPEGVPLGQVMEAIERDIIDPVKQAGLIDSTMRVRLEGSAAKLDEVRTALLGDLSGDRQAAAWQKAVGGVSLLLAVAGLAVGGFGVVRAVRRRSPRFAYGGFGGLLLAVTLAGLLSGVAFAPELTTARLIWALVVTYLLMSALFESFLYPFVIMFTVPLAVVGGFAGLKIVHDITINDPLRAPQQLDVLTMLGFIILIGVVVNNAILLVHQALNFMRGDPEMGEGEPMEPLRAVAEAVRTRVRPIFMSMFTSVGGMLPLVLFPGAGSELYRGLGSVVIGGLLVSTVFTLLLAPLFFSLVLQMADGFSVLFARDEKEAAGARTPASREPEARPEPELQPA